MKWWILIWGVALLLFGIVAMFSVSIYESFSFTLGAIARGTRFGDPSHYYYFNAHLKNIMIALVGGLCVYFFIPTAWFKNHKIVTWAMIAAVVFQALVFVPGIGRELNGARGWLDIPGLPSIQPVELYKVMYMIFIASWLMRKARDGVGLAVYKKFAFINMALLSILVFIPDFGMIVIIGLTSIVMFWYAGAKLRDLVIIGGLGLGGLFVLLTILGLFSDKFSYITDRVSYFLMMKSGGDVVERQQTVGRQNTQALMAIGGGGFWGQGYGRGIQKFGYIPEAQSDFIFAAFSEEIGFVGNMILLLLYGGLAFTVLYVTLILRNKHDRILAIGIVCLIIIQVFVHMGVNLKILPNTGVTLPFVSHGGSGILANIVQLVILFKLCSQDVLEFDTMPLIQNRRFDDDIV
ncbi:MAG: FtsW/RodA/SpoVE family cell cycle protein [Candidatus Absconditabacterales bacterium]|nr:FtsW/RodA/SpoVE family cell cycle protein [Candidatus Absconditabacterales bacterium]